MYNLSLLVKVLIVFLSRGGKSKLHLCLGFLSESFATTVILIVVLMKWLVG